LPQALLVDSHPRLSLQSEPVVNKSLAKPIYLRRALGVALCYGLAFQTFVAAYGIALAASSASGTDPAFVICHAAGGGAPADRDPRAAERIACAVCATACSVIGPLPALPFDIAAASRVAAGGWHKDLPSFASPFRARAGLARAPPHLA